MKINREKLESSIEEIISNGIVSGEEVDITTKKIMDLLSDLINYKSLLLRESEAWPLIDIMRKLLFATDFLLHRKNYDRVGWEEIEHCFNLGNDFVRSLEPHDKKDTIS